MILVVGGMASGKRSYVESLGFASSSFDEGVLGSALVLYGLEDILRAGALSDDQFEVLCTKDVVVCTEVGSGVVPMDKQERVWRELVGRTTATLAARATCVVRMVCGIPQVLIENEQSADRHFFEECPVEGQLDQPASKEG